MLSTFLILFIVPCVALLYYINSAQQNCCSWRVRRNRSQIFILLPGS